ncbi:hypothetical protein [Yunchengibacter salinarum]|uniref:hypothetical protein n=1 Tax=Yunchengibacter salinarum TaxID=3133399 RepID=UPI0035B61365
MINAPGDDAHKGMSGGAGYGMINPSFMVLHQTHMYDWPLLRSRSEAVTIPRRAEMPQNRRKICQPSALCI